MAMQSGFIKRIRDIMRMDAGINGDAQRIEQMVWMLFLKVYDAKEDDWELNEDNYESIIPEDLRWRNWAKADGNGHAMTGDKLLNFVNNTLFPVLKGNDVKEGDTIVYEGIKVAPDTPIKKAIVKSTFEDANNYMKDGVYLRQVIDVIDEIEFDDVKESHALARPDRIKVWIFWLQRAHLVLEAPKSVFRLSPQTHQWIGLFWINWAA